MSFNPAASYSQGLQMGQQNKIASLKNALSGQAQQQGFNPSQSQEFGQLNALDPASAQGIYKTYQALDDDRKKAIYQDASKALGLLEKGDNENFVSLVTNRIENVQRLGGDPSGAASVLQRFQSGDVQGAVSQLKNTVNTGIQEGYLKDPLDRELKEAKLSSLKNPSSSNYAPQISPVQTDPKTGQKYIIKTDRNTEESTRVDVDGALGESIPKEEQRLIRRELLKDAGAESKEAFKSLKVIKQSLGTMDEAIAAIDKGASSGVGERFFPSFKQATIELENAANRMGLDVVSATTFGALSEGELKLAMDTAMPSNLEPQALKSWLVDRKKAKQKLGRELNKMAISLGKGKVTIAEYLEQNATFGDGNNSDNQQGVTLSDEDLLKKYGG